MVNVPQVLFFIMISVSTHCVSLFMSCASIFFFFSCSQRSRPLFVSCSKKKKKQSRHIMMRSSASSCVCPLIFFFQSPFARVQSVSERREFEFWSAAFFFPVFLYLELHPPPKRVECGENPHCFQRNPLFYSPSPCQ